MTARLRRLAVLVLPVILVSAGCGARPEPARSEVQTAPFAGCAGLSSPPVADATPAGSGSADAASADALPELELPCFTGGDRVPLRAVRGPAVVNLWASWCHPCRKELPAFQRLTERLDGEAHVIGVNARDDRAAAQSLAEELGLTYPNLFDPDDELRRALGRPYLPITLFVDAEGRVRHLDQSGALDDAELADLVERHLGVVVRS
jgi:thiol-disulfide isomerase/thioredoxin